MFERDSGAEDRSFLKKIPFEYLVLDEAHCIKNSQSSRYQVRREREREREERRAEGGQAVQHSTVPALCCVVLC
jgi:hypothetical protein